GWFPRACAPLPSPRPAWSRPTGWPFPAGSVRWCPAPMRPVRAVRRQRRRQGWCDSSDCDPSLALPGNVCEPADDPPLQARLGARRRRSQLYLRTMPAAGAHAETSTPLRWARGPMEFLIVLAALAFLMLVAYRGYSVILFAPVAALGAVLLTDPSLVAPMFTGLFMDKMVGFLKNYFPVFLLGAIFGKVIELSGFSKAIVAATIRLFGASRAILSIVIVCALLTYGGVSLFVVVFAVYPFAAELFRQSDIPKRLIPGTIALGAFTFTMDALPGTPQIQNIIPTTFFGTNTWAAPWLGTIGGIFILAVGLAYLDWRRRVAARNGEGYGDPATLVNEPVPFTGDRLAHPLLAILPLLLVGVSNLLLTWLIPQFYGTEHSFVPRSEEHTSELQSREK